MKRIQLFALSLSPLLSHYTAHANQFPGLESGDIALKCKNFEMTAHLSPHEAKDGSSARILESVLIIGNDRFTFTSGKAVFGGDRLKHLSFDNIAPGPYRQMASIEPGSAQKLGISPNPQTSAEIDFNSYFTGPQTVSLTLKDSPSSAPRVSVLDCTHFNSLHSVNGNYGLIVDTYYWGPYFEEEMHRDLLRPIFESNGSSKLQEIETQMYLGGYELVSFDANMAGVPAYNQRPVITEIFENAQKQRTTVTIQTFWNNWGSGTGSEVGGLKPTSIEVSAP